MEAWIPVIVVFLFGLWVLALYNRLVQVTNAVRASWSGIDTELKRRHDLIPNLVETVKGYAAHEKDVLDKVVTARNAAIGSHGNRASLANDENALAGRVRDLLVVAEGYPSLKADRHFLELQEQLTHTEDRIQRARRFYNGNVRDLANCVQAFPTNIVARLFGFREAEYLEIESAIERQSAKVSLGG